MRCRLLGRVTLSVPALTAGILFAVHPVHGEAVNLATYRTTLIASVAVLAALWIHVRGTKHARWAVPVLFAVGLMGKESALVAPALMVLSDLATGRVRAERWSVVRRYWGVLAVAVGYVVVHGSLTGAAELDFFVGSSGWATFCTMMKVFLLDVRLMLVAWPLTPFYDWTLLPITDTLADPEALAGLVLLASSLGAMAWALWRGRGVVLVTLGVFVVALLPYCHLVTFFDAAGERFLYLPSVGACAGAGLGLGLAVRRRYRPRLLVGLAVALGLAFTVLTVQRTPHFDSSQALLAETARLHPHSFNAQYALGQLALRDGDPARALPYLERAHALLPDLEAAGLTLAGALVGAGREDEARRFLGSEIRRLGDRAPSTYQTLLERLGGGARQPGAADWEECR